MKTMRGLLFFFLLSNISVYGQNFRIGHTSRTLTDSARSNRSVPVEIYYPSDSTGDDVPISSSGNLFPAITFGHGFLMSWSAYQYLWESLVQNGFVVIFPKTETGFSPSHSAFASDLLFTL